jgi:hypothetical protein
MLGSLGADCLAHESSAVELSMQVSRAVLTFPLCNVSIPNAVLYVMIMTVVMEMPYAYLQRPHIAKKTPSGRRNEN